MPSFTTYPRCYIKRLPADKGANALSKGDAELMTLWDLYMNSQVDTTTWGFRKRVLAVAIRLFDHFPDFVNDQSNSPLVVGYNLDFLKDTLNYIETGVRRIGVLQWLELVSEIDEVSTVDTGQHLNLATYRGLRCTADTITKWWSWPEGFEDSLLSLFVLFGSQRNVNASGDSQSKTPAVSDA
jgi:hypothetical protein